MVQAVFFDMDGVLLDTERYGMALLPKLAARRGYNMTEEIYKRVLGSPAALVKKLFQDALGPAYPYEQLAEEYWNEMMLVAKRGELPRKEGLTECLQGLRERQLKLALVTSTKRQVVEAYLQSVPEMRDAFDAVVCGSDVEKGKPAPDGYLLAARTLGLSPMECIGVEDSRNGLRSLKDAGIPAVMIPDLMPYEGSLAELVTWKLDSLLEICPLVDRLNENP